MKTILKSLLLVSLLISVGGCCERRCGIHKQGVQDIPQPEIDLKLNNIKKEMGGK